MSMRTIKPPKVFNRDLLRQEPVRMSHVAAVKKIVTQAHAAPPAHKTKLEILEEAMSKAAKDLLRVEANSQPDWYKEAAHLLDPTAARRNAANRKGDRDQLKKSRK